MFSMTASARQCSALCMHSAAHISYQHIYVRVISARERASYACLYSTHNRVFIWHAVQQVRVIWHAKTSEMTRENASHKTQRVIWHTHAVIWHALACKIKTHAHAVIWHALACKIKTHALACRDDTGIFVSAAYPYWRVLHCAVDPYWCVLH